MTWLAVYDPEWGSREHPEFETEEKAQDYINTKGVCEPMCECCLAEWHTCEKDKFDECNTFEEYLCDGLGMYISYFKCKECGHGNDIEKPTHDKNLKCKKCGEAK